MQRSVSSFHTAVPAVDGDGVNIQRIGARPYEQFDPFLMLDEFRGGEDGQPVRGFPEHPHRGFETVTYMLEGAIEHRDHMGNVGRLVAGGVQWMTAGRGVVHSEMPVAGEHCFHGFQLWVNLPATEKMTAPRYREYAPAEIPSLQLPDGGAIKLIAGHLTLDGQTVTGPVEGVATRPDYFDIHLPAGQSLTLPVDAGKRLLLYAYRGEIRLPQPAGANGSSREVTLRNLQLATLEDGDEVSMTATEDSRLLWLAARPISEPVASWGPFVMNTREEIEQALDDYRQGRLV